MAVSFDYDGIGCNLEHTNNQTYDKGGLTNMKVKKLYEITKKLVENGKGDYYVYAYDVDTDYYSDLELDNTNKEGAIKGLVLKLE